VHVSNKLIRHVQQLTCGPVDRCKAIRGSLVTSSSSSTLSCLPVLVSRDLTQLKPLQNILRIPLPSSIFPTKSRILLLTLLQTLSENSHFLALRKSLYTTAQTPVILSLTMKLMFQCPRLLRDCLTM